MLHLTIRIVVSKMTEISNGVNNKTIHRSCFYEFVERDRENERDLCYEESILTALWDQLRITSYHVNSNKAKFQPKNRISMFEKILKPAEHKANQEMCSIVVKCWALENALFESKLNRGIPFVHKDTLQYHITTSYICFSDSKHDSEGKKIKDCLKKNIYIWLTSESFEVLYTVYLMFQSFVLFPIFAIHFTN